MDSKEIVYGNLVKMETVDKPDYLIIPADSNVTSVDNHHHCDDGKNPITFDKWYTINPLTLQKEQGGLWWEYLPS
jgi:hypothetical protein